MAQSGRVGAVTIATNMAGRGTDIILGGNAEFMARLKLREMLMPRYLLFQPMHIHTTKKEKNLIHICSPVSKWLKLLTYCYSYFHFNFFFPDAY